MKIKSALNFGLPNKEDSFSDSSVSSVDNDRFWFTKILIREI